MMEFMDRSEILRILMPERTKQIALAWSILRQSHLSEDAYQDMLAKVFENEGVFEGPGHLRDWSWKVLRNRCYELIRQRKYKSRCLTNRSWILWMQSLSAATTVTWRCEPTHFATALAD
jgi:DNA-directed RNA polymerase specialized sigma24 family protein